MSMKRIFGHIAVQGNGAMSNSHELERPKKWSGSSRDQINTEDLASAARGLVAQFGTWSVDEAGKTLTRKIIGALNPLNAGREQKIQISLSGDQLTLTDPSSGVAGGKTETVYRRAK